MKFYCPRDFKNGKYYFNKFDTLDLFFLIPLVLIGTCISVVSISIMAEGNFLLSMIGLVGGMTLVCVAFLLMLPFKMYHNILQRIIVEIKFHSKQKVYKWHGFDFNNYEND